MAAGSFFLASAFAGPAAFEPERTALVILFRTQRDSIDKGNVRDMKLLNKMKWMARVTAMIDSCQASNREAFLMYPLLPLQIHVLFRFSVRVRSSDLTTRDGQE